jgi:UDP-N-acetylglucosamine 1-carboxyvinyltransferase
MAERMWSVVPSGPLRGDVTVRGSKNAVTKHMVAAMLADGPSVIRQAPEVGDVQITADILEALGVPVEIDAAQGTITVDGTPHVNAEVPLSFSGLNRIPILMLGPLLHRTGEAFVPLVGGDAIGRRPVDFHIGALRQFGVEIEERSDGVAAKATKLRGARIELPYPSVGATETVLLTAALAEGRTVLRNAATEPEVVELALFLQRMGARIELAPDRKFVIEGVDHLEAAETTLAGDRNEAFSSWPASSPAARCGSTAAARTAWSPPSPPSTAWAPASRSPTTSCGRPRPTGCARPRCTPTRTPGS